MKRGQPDLKAISDDEIYHYIFLQIQFISIKSKGKMLILRKMGFYTTLRYESTAKQLENLSLNVIHLFYLQKIVLTQNRFDIILATGKRKNI
jgi:hypothetical protein